MSYSRLTHVAIKWGHHPDVRRARILTKDTHRYLCFGGKVWTGPDGQNWW